jgi:two-component system NtrC family sensor kinase
VSTWQRPGPDEVRASRRLRWRMVAALLFVSAVPFLLLGGGAWLVFRDLAIEEALALHRSMARAHAAAIDAYLSEQVRTVELIARTHTREELSDSSKLRAVLAAVSAVQGNSFVDLGVIAEDGRHLAYVGPYDLLDRNYRDADWFREVMDRGTSISNVFLGFRQSPHSVIAVRLSSRRGPWILRATLDNHSLYKLVRSLAVGLNGDVFLVDRDGVYQTPPRSGEVLDTSSVVGLAPYGQVRDARLDTPAGKTRQVATRLDGKDWLLVVRQPEREILAPVARAVGDGGLITLFAVLMVCVATIFVTTRLIAQIDRANRERDLMYTDLLRSARFASLGEMATGLAHEIDTPLAIMSEEHASLSDRLDHLGSNGDTRAALELSLQRCRRQVERCADITAKMLQFGRPAERSPSATPVEPELRETVALLGHRAEAAGVSLSVEATEDLPPAWVDANELEQVVLNLLNNSLDAVSPGGSVRVGAHGEGDHIVLWVTDDGCGIEREDLDRLFQPFFTTKPPGMGTGLGLAVVHGIVRGWGGTIDVDSTPGEGTTFTIHLPVARPVPS